jgi:hypothetical protein
MLEHPVGETLKATLLVGKATLLSEFATRMSHYPASELENPRA